MSQTYNDAELGPQDPSSRDVGCPMLRCACTPKSKLATAASANFREALGTGVFVVE